ncbi:MAG: hypothetical protein Q8K64_03975 [Sediminibacterium sp.]|nr:hypothetical protein [Sediminibacterium sp.]
MKKIFLLLLFLNGYGLHLIAQEVYNYELKGNRYYFSYAFDKAIAKYTLAKKLSIPAQRKLADSYHHTNQPLKAEKIYLDIIKATKEVLPEDYYNYAMACKVNGKYTEADKWMQYFSLLKPTDLRAIDYKLNSNKLPSLMKNSSEFTIHNLAINTEALDFGTAYYKNKVVFSSSRSNGISNKEKYNWTRKPFWGIYIADRSDSELINTIPFDKSITSNLNDGPVSFSNNGSYMAFTRNHVKDKSEDQIVELQIYFSHYQDSSWSKPVPFILNSPYYSVAQPCLTPDGKTMYFTSDMPGGFGKADIYMISKNEKGEWGTPRNLGKTVNTEGDDMFPFLSDNQDKLFFASDGHFGLGGMDIFCYELNQSDLSKVINLGAPVNSSNNDYGFIMNTTHGNGYFSSDRVGGKGGDDIYSFTVAKHEEPIAIIPPIVIPKSVESPIQETFPIRNYIFFNKNETTIPTRYTLIEKDAASIFSEEKVLDGKDKSLANRSKRQLTVYYNILNILGARMKKNPVATITLVGSTENGITEGMLMAETVKRYLRDHFDIPARQISAEGMLKPKIPSEQPGGKLELALLQEGDRRVSIESSFPDIMKEFEVGTIETIETILRFSIIFEFDDAKSIQLYNTFLTEKIAPKIPLNATVVLNGYTDIIGEGVHNSELSLLRMKTVQSILENTLHKAGRYDVLFETYWHGEDATAMPFANKLPEERFYNRTVFIDVIPKK